MIDTRRERLLNQYEDVDLELLMDEFAEADGERLWNDFQKAGKNREIALVLESVNVKCKRPQKILCKRRDMTV